MWLCELLCFGCANTLMVEGIGSLAKNPKDGGDFTLLRDPAPYIYHLR